MLDRYSVIDKTRNRQYLLEKTQHLVGGFGKAAGDPPGKLIQRVQRGELVLTKAFRYPPLIFRVGVDGFSG